MTVGDSWTSRGKIPMHRPAFDDRSRVTAAEPGRVFDRTISLREVPDGYRAMDKREAIKVMVEP